MIAIAITIGMILVGLVAWAVVRGGTRDDDYEPIEHGRHDDRWGGDR